MDRYTMDPDAHPVLGFLGFLFGTVIGWIILVVIGLGISAATLAYYEPWRQNKETIQVLNLQKSSAGTGLLFNLGIYVRLLGNECNPPAGRCHIQARLEGVTGQQEAAIILAAWAGSSTTAELAPIVLRDGVGWLDKLSTLAAIRQHVGSGLAERILVVDAVRELIAEPA